MSGKLKYAMLLTLLVLWPLKNSAAAGGKAYKPDLGPLKANSEAFQKYQKNMAVLQQRDSAGHYDGALGALESVLNENPKWKDGQWMMAHLAISYSMAFKAKKEDFPKSRRLLKRAEKHSKRCLELDEKNPLCRYVMAATYGGLATIDGIVASLKFGKDMQEHFLAVYKSEVDYDFGTKGSLRANVRHALGMFRRLVPDSMMVSLTFGIRGDLEESVKFHREAAEHFELAPCSTLMTGLAEYCYADDEGDSGLKKSALERVRSVTQMQTSEFDEGICIRDAHKILADPDLSCSYHRAILAE